MNSHNKHLVVRNIIVGVVIAVLTFVIIVNSIAADVSLQWDANDPSEKVTRYNVYWGNYSGNTSKFVFTNRSSTTSTQKTITVDPAKKWYSRVTAVNGFSESLFSNVVEMIWSTAPRNHRRR